MSNYGRKPSAKIKEIDEVEELLRATEDAMVLKLSVNSHLSSSSSSSPLDQDLLSRFEALKKPSVSKKTTKVPSGSSELKKDDCESDPFARFSALKGGGAGGDSSIIESEIAAKSGCGDVNEEDEVEKLMQWAMDAARLDPSVSDEEEDECLSSEDDLDDDEDTEDTEDEKEKEKMKKYKEKEMKKKKKSSKNRK